MEFSIHLSRNQVDVDRLVELNKEAWEWLPIPATYWWIVRNEDGKEVGHTAIRLINPKFDKTLNDKSVVFMGPTFIGPECRGHGLQRKLLQVREQFAIACGCKLAITSTVRDNYASANNLIKSGYYLSPPLLKGYHPDDLWWRKEIKNENNRSRVLEHLSNQALFDEVRTRLDIYSRP